MLRQYPDEDESAENFGRPLRDNDAWIFCDERDVDRLSHSGDTIVPGAGVRWKHVHRQSRGASRGAQYLGRGTQLTKAPEDNEDELPWQVIAVLDYDILRQLVCGAEYHKDRVAEAMAGRGVVDPPALTSLEGCYQPGNPFLLYRVIAEEGVPLLAAPSIEATPCGRRKKGDYLRGDELRCGGNWLKLDGTALVHLI